MDEEANEDEGDEDMCSPSPKRIRTEPLALDDEEAEIASGLRPVHGTSQVASQLEEDKTMGQDDDSAGAEDEADAVNEYSGDGGTGFENNGACP
jgi:hypothetical protein